MVLDAVVVGSGPNGLTAAVTLAEHGSVRVLEAESTIGGGTRSAELTLPGFLHDVCSAVHPLAVASPAFERLPLAEEGLEWVHPDAPLAHPFDDGTAAMLERSVRDTGATLGCDGSAYERLIAPLVGDWPTLRHHLLAPAGRMRRPFALARFAVVGIPPAESLARRYFAGHRARGLFAGLAAHSGLPLDRSPTSAIGLVLAIAGHAGGWPFPRGGAGRIASALARILEKRGGSIETGRRIHGLSELPPARTFLFDVIPSTLLEIAGPALPRGYRRKLARFRHGPGVFKVDWALSEPIPWRAEECARAGTVHLGGSLEEIASAERQVWSGRRPDRPFVLLAQPTLFDPSRAPEGRHTAWAYCHVPNGFDGEMTAAIEAQVERFAPGFRECVLACSALTPSDLESRNANYRGGDITGGVQDLRQTLARPTLISPYATPRKGLYLCSASTPPGGGVHGMCGYHAARVALRRSQSS